MANTHSTLTGLFTDIADAIREKTGDTGDTLTWDGNTEGLEVAVEGMNSYLVSSATPSIADFVNGAELIVDGSPITVPSSEVEEPISGYIVVGEWAVIITTDNLVLTESITIRSKGVYLRPNISSLTIPGYTGFASKIVADNFPEAIGEIETIPEDALFLGFDWDSNTLPSSQSWCSLAYGNGKFVAVALNTDKAAYSTDGIAWTETTLPSSASWTSVTYGDGKFVAVTNKSDISAYSADGINWTASTMPRSAVWQSVTYGNGKFVAIACNSTSVAYSTDGITWTASTMPNLAMWYSVTYGNGKFVAVVYNSDLVAYSEDGITWTASTMPSSSYWHSVTYGNGKFVAVAFFNGPAYSEDGITWIETAIPGYGQWFSVSYGNGKFVAVMPKSDKAAYSTDGITWTASTMPNLAMWYSVTYGNGKFVAVANGSDTVAYIQTKIVDVNNTDVTEETVQATGILDAELTTQDNLITQLTSALEGKAGVTSGGGSSASITIKSGENFSCEGPSGLSGGFVPCLSYTFEEDVFFQAGSTIIIDDESVVM